MTEHSGQEDLASTLRRTLDKQHTFIQSHDTALRTLSEQQTATIQCLEHLSATIQEFFNVAFSPPSADVRSPGLLASLPLSSLSDHFSQYQRNLITMVSLGISSPVFSQFSTYCISSLQLKNFIIGLLSGTALTWAESRFQN